MICLVNQMLEKSKYLQINEKKKYINKIGLKGNGVGYKGL